MPTTNVGFLSAIMWDGREPSLENQAVDATLTHAVLVAGCWESLGHRWYATSLPAGMQLSMVVEPPQRLILSLEVFGAVGKLRSLIPTRKFWQKEAKLAKFSKAKCRRR